MSQINLIKASTTSIKLFEATKRRAKILIHVNFFILIKLFEKQDQIPTIFSGTEKKLCCFIFVKVTEPERLSFAWTDEERKQCFLKKLKCKSCQKFSWMQPLIR